MTNTVAQFTSPVAIEDEWPALVSLDQPQLSKLPLDSLPSWAGDFTRALSIATETPYELAACMVLGAVSTAVAPTVAVEVKAGYIEVLPLWLVCALPPGNRKSAVQSAAISPLNSYEERLCESKASEIAQCISERATQEQRIKELRRKAARAEDSSTADLLAQEVATLEASLTEIPRVPRLWTSDVTPERLGVLLEDNDESIAWLSAEGGLFDMLQGRYSNGIPNLDLILKSHSGDPDRVDRSGRPSVSLKSPKLVICLSTQPDVLSGLAHKPGFSGRGLLARFGYFIPASPLGHRSHVSDPVPQRTKQAYHDGLEALLEIERPAANEVHLLKLSDGASAERLDFAKGIERLMGANQELDQMADWAGKAPGLLVRIAASLHLIKYSHDNRWNRPIERESMLEALGLMKVLIEHSQAAYQLMGADVAISKARVLWEWIVRRGVRVFSARDAFNALRAGFPQMKFLMEALWVLEERGYVKVLEEERDGPGRPRSPTVLVRPGMELK